MASQNKKHKARNSYIIDGGEKNDAAKWKCKRIAYYTKRDRRLLNNSTKHALFDESGRKGINGSNN